MSCVIEYETQLFRALYCMHQIYGINVTSGNVMPHIVYTKFSVQCYRLTPFKYNSY